MSIGITRTATDNNYIAYSKDNPLVAHAALEFAYDGSLRYKQQAHQPDGTTLNMATAFMADKTGRFGINTINPTEKLEVVGNIKITGAGNGLRFPDGTIQKTAAPTGGTGSVTVTEGDSSIVIAGTATVPTIAVATNGITTAKIADGAVTNVKLANSSVTAAKISGTLSPAVITGTAATLGSNSFVGPQTVTSATTSIAGITTTDSYPGVYGAAQTQGGTGGEGAGVTGQSDGQSGNGVRGIAEAEYGFGMWGLGGWVGVYGQPLLDSGNGVEGDSSVENGAGVLGYNSADTGVAIYAIADSGYAGVFEGPVSITDLSVSGVNYGQQLMGDRLTYKVGGYQIDHPLDPTKYLNHSTVNSPEMLNVYSGNVALDGTGAATVTLPDYFEAINTDYRYHLTAIGAAMPNLHVATEISGNAFSIEGGVAGGKVSWQVTGVRNDQYAIDNPLPDVEDKVTFSASKAGKMLTRKAPTGRRPAKRRQTTLNILH
jgi:hypothetical protein